jgi:hypothetical protein
VIGQHLSFRGIDKHLVRGAPVGDMIGFHLQRIIPIQNGKIIGIFDG